jgi:hypothetical protein
MLNPSTKIWTKAALNLANIINKHLYDKITIWLWRINKYDKRLNTKT